MKKLFFLLVAATLVVTTSFAQSSLVATLSHNGEISVFHGAASLKQAMEAAEHGDIITLASGRYEATNITKAVTLRGAGMKEDLLTGALRTQIIGDFAIDIQGATSEHLTIEGVYHEYRIVLCGIIENMMLQKCQFKYITYSSGNNTVHSLTCIHCNITHSMQLPMYCSARFISCSIQYPSNMGGNMEFTNCIIHDKLSGVNNSSFTNCFLNDWMGGILNGTNMATYCAGRAENSEGPFGNIPSTTNKTLSTEEFNALFKPDTFWELTDEAKQEYIGSDGKEIGIYGGNLPYETRILSPQITKCNVAAKTTADGKLSVDIEVKAAE